MIGGVWMGGLNDPGFDRNRGNAQTHHDNLTNQTSIRELQHQVQRLSLLNQALWELLQERTGLTDRDLEAKAEEVDLRDGKPDGKISEVAVRCPTCQRVCNSKHEKCLYCGTLFQKPIFG
jgi:hypothetical protein